MSRCSQGCGIWSGFNDLTNENLLPIPLMPHVHCILAERGGVVGIKFHTLLYELKVSIKYKLYTCLQKLCAPCVTHSVTLILHTQVANVVLTCRPRGEESIHNHP